MLNILVCVKQVPDINLVKMDPVTGSLIRAGVPAILNPLDANALEAAVRVKEAHGGSITVTGNSNVTVGGTRWTGNVTIGANSSLSLTQVDFKSS